MKRFQGGLVLKAHRRLYHSALASKMIEKNQFSPCPTPQSSAQFRESYFPLIKEARRMLGEYVNAPVDDLVMVEVCSHLTHCID